MSKASNKLTSGLRKVKEQQAAKPPAEKRPVPKEDSVKAAAAAKPPGTKASPVLHPSRIWPD